VCRLGFRVGVSASYSYFRRVRNFDFVYTAAVSVPLAYLIFVGVEKIRFEDLNIKARFDSKFDSNVNARFAGPYKFHPGPI